MNYYLFKLCFSTPLHIGTGESAHSLESAEMTFSADTLFSALCHTAIKVGCLDELVASVKDGRLMLSDAFPYSESGVFLPKPILPAKVKPNSDPSERKKYKKLKFIPACLYRKYIDYLRSGAAFDINEINTRFGEAEIFEKVSQREEIPTPYSVGAFSFFGGCGLYIIVGCDCDACQRFTSLLTLLGLGGIGGKVSSGYGKFTISERADISARSDIDTAALDDLLGASDADTYINLTAFSPNDRELDSICESGYYQLVRRAGFVYSSDLDEAVKKKTQYGFAVGSCFKKRYKGELCDVGRGLSHPVYRYGIPIYMGIKYD